MDNELKYEIGAVLTYYFKGSLSTGGQTVGANGQGHYCKIYLGSVDIAERDACKFIEELNKRHFNRVVDVTIIAQHEGWTGMPIEIVDLGI